MSKQTPEQTPDEDERGSLARPPWLPGEKKRRRVQLGRGKRHDEVDERRDDKSDRLASPPEDTAVLPKRERVPVEPRRPDAAVESEAALAHDMPESRPKRVAVPFDRIRRLQQIEPEPAPPVSELPAEPESPAPDLPTAEVAGAFAAGEPAPDAPTAEVSAEAEAESVEWVSEALTRLEWQYDSLLASSLVMPEAAMEVSAEPESEPVAAASAEFGSADNEADSEPELPLGFEQPVEPEPDSLYAVEPVAPVVVSDIEAESDFALSGELEIPEVSAEPEPAAEVSAEQEWFSESPVEAEPVSGRVEPEPVPVSTERLWEPPLPTEPDPAIDVLPEPQWDPEFFLEPVAETVLAPVEPEPVPASSEQFWEPPPTEPEPVVAAVESEKTTEESGSGELDEIELRAAALLEQMAAKRAQATAAPQEPEVDPIADDAADAEASDRRFTEQANGTDAADQFEPRGDEVPADDAVPTQWLPTDLVSDVAAHEDSPISDSEWFAGEAPTIPSPASRLAEDELADEAVVTQVESPSRDEVPDVGRATAERANGPRRPAPPPWQTPSPAMAAEIEEVAMDAPVPQHQPAPAPERHQPPTQQGPSAPSPQPPAPTPPARLRPRSGGRPPWPPPPPPGPFPPPPWWPGPPPGQRIPPQTRPAASAPPPRAPQPVPPPARPQPPVGGPPPGYQPFRVPPSIDEAEITNLDRFAPPSGWRRAVHKATGGHVNPGVSRKERQQEHLLAEIRQPIVGDFRIAVLSIKGGVGKTTTTFGLGSALATVRHDRVIAVDANPDRGTLGERVGDTSTRSTVRDLLSDPNINRYADVRNHTLMATSRLEVLASEQDPAVSEVFGADDYRRTVDILRHYYNIILTDCGTGIMHSAMSAVLDLAHTIVLVSSPAIDAARSASATLDWLMQHGHSGLVREAHVVLSASRPGSAALKLDKVYEHFQSRCRSIHLIPFDPHLAEGADVDFGRLNPATRQAYLELAGSVAENFGRLRAPREQS